MSAPHSAYTHPAAHANPPPLRFAHRRLNLVLRTNHPTVHEFARRQFAPVLDTSNRLYDHYAFIRAGSERIEVFFDGERLFEALAPKSADGKAVAMFYAVRDCFTHAVSCANECVIYGASVSLAGSGVLVLGPPGSGKTLTAVHIAAAGGELLGDDVAVLTPDGMLDAVPRALSLRSSAIPLLPPVFPRDSARSPLIGEGDDAVYALSAERCGVRQATSPVPLRAVVIIDPGAAPGVVALDPAAAAVAFGRYRQRAGRLPRGIRTFVAGLEPPVQLAQRLCGVVRCA